MDAKFHPAISAIKSGDLDGLRVFGSDWQRTEVIRSVLKGADKFEPLCYCYCFAKSFQISAFATCFVWLPLFPLRRLKSISERANPKLLAKLA